MFGALLMVFIAALLSYGLKNNYTQQVMQQTFRKALALAKKEKNHQANYIFVNDRHIPDPSDTFGQGSFTPTSSSAFITRNYEMTKTADTIDELPAIAIEIKGNASCPGSVRSPQGSAPPCYYITAGFRGISIQEGGTKCAAGDTNCENCEKEDKWEKYKMIYGVLNIQGLKQDLSVWYVDDDGWETLSSIKVIDSCEGEILSYEGCKKQCKIITDQGACIKDCQLGGVTWSTCARTCSATIETPWYCQKDPATGTDVLDQTFNFALNNLKTMGLQGYTDETYTKSDMLRKQETKDDITTTHGIGWDYDNTRMIIFRSYSGDRGVVTQPITGTVSGQKKESWQTPFDK